MRKFLYTIIICFCLSNVSSQIYVDTIRNTSHGPTFRHHNGYKDYTIVPVLSVQGNDSLYMHELKFTSTSSAMFTQQLMYDRFGRWSKELKIKNQRHPALLWEKVKLFENSDATFDVSASGNEAYRKTYSSVMIFNSENDDCLSEKALTKERLINYFSEGLKTLKKRSKFYPVYWAMFEEYSNQ